MSSGVRQRIHSRRRIYLLRHGEVSYFDAHGRPYPQDGVPLNTEGMEQADAARRALQHIPMDLAVHSGLRRTQQTLEIILQGRNAAVACIEGFQEVRPGPLPSASAEAGFEGYFVDALGGHIGRESRFLGGETFGSLEDRVIPAFRGLLSEGGWKHLLIVAHGGVNRIILLNCLNAGMESLGRLEQEAGCINILDVEESGEVLVRQMNFTPYSPIKDSIWARTMEKIYLDYFDRVTALKTIQGLAEGE